MYANNPASRYSRSFAANTEILKHFLRSIPAYKHPHLLRIASEQKRLALAELADAAFAGLTPARVIDPGIDVGINNHQLKLVGLNYGLKVRIRVD